MTRQVNHLVFVEQVQIRLKIKSGGYHSQNVFGKVVAEIEE